MAQWHAAAMHMAPNAHLKKLCHREEVWPSIWSQCGSYAFSEWNTSDNCITSISFQAFCWHQHFLLLLHTTNSGLHARLSWNEPAEEPLLSSRALVQQRTCLLFCQQEQCCVPNYNMVNIYYARLHENRHWQSCRMKYCILGQIP